MQDTRSELETLIRQHVAVAEPLFKAHALAQWEAHTTGRPEAQEEAARLSAEVMRLYAQPETFHQLANFRRTPPSDPLLARQLERLYLRYLVGQRDPQVIDRLTQIEKEVRAEVVNYRPLVQGRPVSDNDISAILREETDSTLRREAWEASKEIGGRIADRVRQLARLRNEGARRLGFPDYYHLALAGQELDPGELFDLLDRLAKQTEEPFRRAKEWLDRRLARRFGVPPHQLRPWHYSDPFFQQAPSDPDLDLSPYLEGKDLEELARRTYEGIGMEIDDILARSDLYERPGKDQHAFCMDVDRKGDIRILANLRPIERWMATLLHELGHAVYDKYIDRGLPWLLRRPAHTFTTEAVAILMGRQVRTPRWLREVLGLSEEEVARLADRLARQERLNSLVFVRWALVMVHFERAFYADPDQDLDNLWWDLKERFQLLARPEGRHAPDWAAKYHIALAPVYYHNYILGELFASQLDQVITERFGGVVGVPEAGAFLIERVLAPGARLDWRSLVEHATGRPLTPEPFAAWVSDGTIPSI
ncbi:MAG TPA: peptidase M3A and M3B thimet/oligopeptidase F [Chloroflexi bacterium]|nr:peptidase M3A and M3B thimet/oligopeptidase F [Chloroflexota bacterium]